MWKNDASPRRSICLVALAGLLSMALCQDTHPARAQATDTSPSFSRPLEVTNPLHPFVPGAVKVYSGRDEGASVTVVETHLRETRDFVWNGSVVTCCVVESLTFADGVSRGRQHTYVAQADDGAVWTFGEVDDVDESGDDAEDADEPGGWIVGAARANDREGILSGSAPALAMPASPRVGDEWASEDAPPAYVKTSRAESVHATVPTGAGRRADCLRVVETDAFDGGSERRWFAPGLGLAETRERGARLVLRASTIGRGR